MPLTFDPDSSSLEELERWYARAPVLGRPRGVFRGRHLGWLSSHGSPRWLRPALTVGFRWLPFGVDFDRDVWFFVAKRIRIGRFRADIGQSRWRDAQAVRLHYDVSGLPGRVRGFLYDEVKPIDDRRCLGMGGVNAPTQLATRDSPDPLRCGHGEQFFFLLVRR
jgi:hypothetical protein